jgi:crossover junction endodeoxyribonuclease RuvC
MIALGIDPGSHRTGWGLVRQEGSKYVLLDVGLIKTRSTDPLHLRLAKLHGDLTTLLELRTLDVVGLESVFHGPNTRSLVTLGQARGALLAAVGRFEMPLVDLSPAEVKKAVTGRGAATKDQVAHMIAALLGHQATAKAAEFGKQGRYDATDALAVAVATLQRSAQDRVLARR